MVDQNRLRDELRRMKQLIKTDPAVLARFDRDGNGVIDGDEWEDVVRVVTARLEREAAERHEAADMMREAREAGEAFDGLGAAGQASIADEFFEHDLQRAYGPNALRTGDGRPAAPSLTALHEFVLEQKPGVKAMFEGMMRREYSVCDLLGLEVLTLHEQTSDMSRAFTFTPMGGARNTGFEGTEHATGDRISIGLQWHVMGFDLHVVSRTNIACRVSMVGNLLGRKFELRGMGEETSVYLVRPLLRPFTMKVTDPFDEAIGVCHRGWVGLGGFMTGANRTRFEVDAAEVSPSVRWGLVASALYLDVAMSRRR